MQASRTKHLTSQLEMTEGHPCAMGYVIVSNSSGQSSRLKVKASLLSNALLLFHYIFVQYASQKF